MNRHKLGDQIADDILSCEGVEVVLQKRPYTGVQIAVEWACTTYVAVGFSKVNWPDKWDPHYGLEMAIKKAAHDVARQICEAAGMVLEEATSAAP